MITPAAIRYELVDSAQATSASGLGVVQQMKTTGATEMVLLGFCGTHSN